MSPRSIPIIKERVRGLEIAGLDRTVRDCLKLGRAADVQQLLMERHPLGDQAAVPDRDRKTAET